MVIARNKAFSAAAKMAPELVAELPEPQQESDPGAAMDAVEWRRCLDAALEQLPIAQRSAFVLAEIHELPYAEIAQIEGVELGTVKSRVARAKAALRARVPKAI